MDADLVTRAQNGDESAFAVVVERVVDRFLGAAQRILRDPATASFSPAGSLAQARKNHLAAALPDGRVLIVGGCFNPGDYCEGGDEVDSAELWDPSTATFGPAGSLPEMDAATTVTRLPDGRALFVGGGGAGGMLASAMVWEAGNP